MDATGKGLATLIRKDSPPAAALLVGLCALLSGCTNEPTVSDARSPDVRLGPELELLSFETGGDRVETVVDASGNAHVIISARHEAEVHHVVVSPEGVVERERIETGSKPSVISAAYGSDDRLHVLLDGKHLVREAFAWSAAGSAPWDAAGIEVHSPRFVQGPGGLLWAFDASGKEVGAKGRWEWYAFGGAMGGFVFPWHSASQKLVIVPEAPVAEPLWYVLDPQDNLDASDAMPAVDGRGNLHVVYTAFRGGLATTYEPRYACTALVPVQPATDHAAPAGVTAAQTLVSVRGSPIPWFRPEPGGLAQAASAVDPVSGSVLVVPAHGPGYALDDGKWVPPVPLPLSTFSEPRLTPAGGNAFHLMVTVDARVLYLLYADGGWSAPIEIGQASVASGSLWTELDIAGNGSNRAFAVWPRSTGIVGRWVEAPRVRVSPTRDAAAQPSGSAPIPAQLLDFAAGKAELLTPGLVTGLRAATNAGSNGPLTKYLHDSGQWEVLATLVLKDDYGDDLRWYFLGRAAEGMGLCDAAERYYRISRERSGSFWTRCLGPACVGVELPQLLDARMAALVAMRSAGQCRETAR